MSDRDRDTKPGKPPRVTDEQLAEWESRARQAGIMVGLRSDARTIRTLIDEVRSLREERDEAIDRHCTCADLVSQLLEVGKVLESDCSVHGYYVVNRVAGLREERDAARKALEACRRVHRQP